MDVLKIEKELENLKNRISYLEEEIKKRLTTKS